MEFNKIEDICNALMERAKSNNYLQDLDNEIEDKANKFVEEFSKEHDMRSNTISPFRWSFSSKVHMFEDGVIELYCPFHLTLMKKKPKSGKCEFRFVDVSRSKITQHLD